MFAAAPLFENNMVYQAEEAYLCSKDRVYNTLKRAQNGGKDDKNRYDCCHSDSHV